MYGAFACNMRIARRLSCVHRSLGQGIILRCCYITVYCSGDHFLSGTKWICVLYVQTYGTCTICREQSARIITCNTKTQYMPGLLMNSRQPSQHTQRYDWGRCLGWPTNKMFHKSMSCNVSIKRPWKINLRPAAIHWHQHFDRDCFRCK